MLPDEQKEHSRDADLDPGGSSRHSAQGLPPDRGSIPGSTREERPRFIVDSMLGRLARWLRILGLDAWYFRKIQDKELLSLQGESDRILLTRDTGLIQCHDIGPYVFIQNDRWEAQLREVLEALSLIISRENVLTRCLRCNSLLKILATGEVLGKVPDYVASVHTEFRGCETCDKIYWSGTHRQHISRVLTRLGIEALPGGGH